jgi:hypothetical protein
MTIDGKEALACPCTSNFRPKGINTSSAAHERYFREPAEPVESPEPVKTTENLKPVKATDSVTVTEPTNTTPVMPALTASVLPTVARTTAKLGQPVALPVAALSMVDVRHTVQGVLPAGTRRHG